MARGSIAPRCARCGVSPVFAAANPKVPCQRPNLLPFEFEKPTPAKVELKATTKERAS